MNSEKKRREELKKALDSASAGNTSISMSPADITWLIEEGYPIKETFTSYEDYIEQVYADKKKFALAYLQQIPHLKPIVASSVLAHIYEKIKESLAFGNFSSAIVHSILLLEYSMRIRLHEEYKKHDPNTQWSTVAPLIMHKMIPQLLKHKAITNDQYNELSNFASDTRNPYMHGNYYKLVQNIAMNFTEVGLKDAKTKEHRNESVVDAPALWWAAKEKYDHAHGVKHMHFCMDYVNLLYVAPADR